MNPVTVVTGGSRGIGRATALEAARRGHDVVVAYRTEASAANDVVAEIERVGCRAVAVAVDLAEAAALDPFIDQIRDFGTTRLLVNNAGLTNSGRAEQMTPRDWEQTIAVNLSAPTWLSVRLAPDLRASEGAIVNIASTGALTGSLHSLPYGASKAGIVGVTKTLAGMLAPDVRVNAICPGPIDTDLLAAVGEDVLDTIASETPLQRLGTSDEIARCVLDVSEWDYCTGQTIVVDGGRVKH